MVLWRDVELASSHHEGACRLLVGDPDPPRRQEEPPGECVGCGGMEGGGEVEARQDWHPRGQEDQERQVGGTLGRSRRGAEGIGPTHSSPGSLLGSQVRFPCPLR